MSRFVTSGAAESASDSVSERTFSAHLSTIFNVVVVCLLFELFVVSIR